MATAEDVKQWIMDAASATADKVAEKIENRLGTIENKVDEFSAVAHRRIDSVEQKADEALAATQAQGKLIQDLKAEIDSRNQSPSNRAIVATEIHRSISIEINATGLADIVVLGTRGNQKHNEDGIRSILGSFGITSPLAFQRRGDSGVFGVTCSRSAIITGEAVAQKIIRYFRPTSTELWAKPDRSISHRDLETRAHDFGRAVKERFLPAANSTTPRSSTTQRPPPPPSYYWADGLFVIGEIVVGPLTMIPSGETWGELVPVVEKLLRNPANRRNRRKTLRADINPETIAMLLKFYHDIPNVTEDQEEEDDDMN